MGELLWCAVIVSLRRMHLAEKVFGVHRVSHVDVTAITGMVVEFRRRQR